MSVDVIEVDDPHRAQILDQYFAEQKLKKRGIVLPDPGEPPAKPDRLNSVAQPTVIDGIRFPSKHEAKRYVELKMAERAGIVFCLHTQVLFPLVVSGVFIFPLGYRADFTYVEKQRDGVSLKLIVEDCKPSSGFRTDTYTVKRQLMLAIWGITIRET